MSVRTLSLGLSPFRSVFSDSAGTSLGSLSVNRVAHRRECRGISALCLSAKSPNVPLDLPLLPFLPDEVIFLFSY